MADFYVGNLPHPGSRMWGDIPNNIEKTTMFLRNLAQGGSSSDGARGDGYGPLYEDLARLVEAQRSVMAAMAMPLVALDLDRSALGG